MKAAYLTLGCKVNQYDTNAMQELMEAAGYETVEFSEKADVYLINTCTVTNVADRKSRQMIRRAAEQNPDAVVCVTGCLAQRHKDEILAIEGVNAVVGVNNRGKIVEIVERARKGEAAVAVEDISKEKRFEPLTISRMTERTRAHIKISDGCDNFCSYCIIPYTRGRVRSRGFDDIIEEAGRLAAGGVKEVVLTGIHISSYGKDLEGVSLIDLIEKIAEIDGIERIRLGSLEPTVLTRNFCARASLVKKLCPHFHISLQSGSAGVLKRMNRHYTPEQYAEFCDNLRTFFIDPAITTDIIAGFNSETDEEHRETVEFTKRIGFAKVHVFVYSEREGTQAVRMGGMLPMPLRKQRAQELIEVTDKLHRQYIEKYVGREINVLFEEEKDGHFYGYTDRYIRVRGNGSSNEMKCVKIIGVQDDVLIAEE